MGVALLFAHFETLSGGAALDDALDLNQSNDAPHRRKRESEITTAFLPRRGRDVGELKGLPACMRPIRSAPLRAKTGERISSPVPTFDRTGPRVGPREI